PDWTLQQPVHAVVIFGRVDKTDVKKWIDQHSADPDYVVTGIVRNERFEGFFPELTPGAPLVFVQDKSQPQSIGSLIALASVLIFIVLILWGIKRASSRRLA